MGSKYALGDGSHCFLQLPDGNTYSRPEGTIYVCSVMKQLRQLRLTCFMILMGTPHANVKRRVFYDEDCLETCFLKGVNWRSATNTVRWVVLCAYQDIEAIRVDGLFAVYR